MQTFLDTTGHLNEKHQAFFKHWDNLLSKEEKGFVNLRRELWSMTSSDREVAGRCFSELVISPGSIAVDQSKHKINKYTYSFQKHVPQGNFSFLESQLNEGDPIVVSDEKGHLALAIGYIFRICKSKITVQVDRRLHNSWTRQKNFDNSRQVFDGIVELPEPGMLEPQMPQVKEKVLYRVDKDEFSNGMANIRNNLIQLMSPDASKCRRLIVNLEAPVFKERPITHVVDDQSTLNDDQRRAVSKVMSGLL
jgi:DNA replication ATP-dependent helicase Dna2